MENPRLVKIHKSTSALIAGGGGHCVDIVHFLHGIVQKISSCQNRAQTFFHFLFFVNNKMKHITE